MPSSRHTEGGAQRRILTSCVVLSVQWLDIRAFARQTIDTIPGMDQRETGILTVGHLPPPPPPRVYLTSSHVTRSPRPSPAVFILEAMKYWWWEWPGNEATSYPVPGSAGPGYEARVYPPTSPCPTLFAHTEPISKGYCQYQTSPYLLTVSLGRASFSLGLRIGLPLAIIGTHCRAPIFAIQSMKTAPKIAIILCPT